MIIVTQSQLRNKDTEAMVLLRNEIKASFNTNAIDYFTISAVAEILYNKFVAEPHYSVCEIDNSVYTYYGNPVFKNEADAQYVIDNPNFRDILDKIFKV